jgi:hypothetical protein
VAFALIFFRPKFSKYLGQMLLKGRGQVKKQFMPLALKSTHGIGIEPMLARTIEMAVVVVLHSAQSRFP